MHAVVSEMETDYAAGAHNGPFAGLKGAICKVSKTQASSSLGPAV
jgi:hypothetical protein